MTKLSEVKSVKVEKNGVCFILGCNIRDDIMKLESTAKTKAFGVPEYMTMFHKSEISVTFRNIEKNDGWIVRICDLKGICA